MILQILKDLYSASFLFGAGWVLAREGLLLQLNQPTAPLLLRMVGKASRLIAKKGRHDNKVKPRYSDVLQKLGPTWIKLGQFASTRPDIFGAAISNDLAKLQDRVPPFSTKEAKDIVARSLDLDIDDVFEEFGAPVAAASIAQVHKVQMKSNPNRSLAIKVLRPGIRRHLKRDMKRFLAASRLAERFSSEARRLKFVEAHQTLERSLEIETDFRMEAGAASELAQNSREHADVRIPEVYWEYCSPDVLACEWIDGTPLSKFDELEHRDLKTAELGDKLVQSFLYHSLYFGFFHADMHAGNIIIDAEGKLAFVDFGIMGRLTENERYYHAQILYGFIKRDYQTIAEIHREAGYLPKNQSIETFAQALRSIGEPVHGKSAREISMGRLLAHLFAYTGLFNMQTRPELILLQKTMVMVEGIARKLNPELDMWTVAEPPIKAWLNRHIGAQGRLDDARASALALARLLNKAPRLIELAEEILENQTDQYQEDKKTQMLRGEINRLNRGLLWQQVMIFFAIITFAFILAFPFK